MLSTPGDLPMGWTSTRTRAKQRWTLSNREKQRSIWMACNSRRYRVSSTCERHEHSRQRIAAAMANLTKIWDSRSISFKTKFRSGSFMWSYWRDPDSLCLKPRCKMIVSEIPCHCNLISCQHCMLFAFLNCFIIFYFKNWRTRRRCVHSLCGFPCHHKK